MASGFWCAVSQQASPPLTVIFNWPALMKKRTAGQ
jgi:hypothetical protein